jgi:hypothetical protein
MHADDWSRMPSLESLVADDKGTALIDDWIKSVVQCPVPRADGGG